MQFEINKRGDIVDGIDVLMAILKGDFITDGKYSIEIKKTGDVRSKDFNKYYWGVVVKTFVQCHNDNTYPAITYLEGHKFLSSKFNIKEEITITTDGVEVKQTRISTSNLSQQEFRNYINNCTAFINDLFNTDLKYS